MGQRLGLLVGLLVAAPLVAASIEMPDTFGAADAAVYGNVARVGDQVHAGGDGPAAPDSETPPAAVKRDRFDAAACPADLVRAPRDSVSLAAAP